MTQVMGIVNVTPDSFSDGGQYFRPEEAVRRARNLIEEGAAIIDFGAESTRPGATPLTWEQEWSRLEPVLSLFFSHHSSCSGSRGRSPSLTPPLPHSSTPPLSIDTYHPETARRSIGLGATILNCVYAEPIPAMLALLREFPQTERVMPAGCGNQVADDAALRSRIYLDPMIGFGTTREEDLELLRSVPDLAKKARVLVGASRKRIVKKLTGEKVTGKNLGGNLGIAVWCALNGAAVVRVHDVRETVQAIKVMETIRGADGVCEDLS